MTKKIRKEELIVPRVFISYTWESEEHINWVRAFAEQLRGNGIESILDRWHLNLGQAVPEFMERSIRENDFVVVICTPIYKEKSDRRLGGVGYEGDIMTGEVYTAQSREKFIPILRLGDWIQSAPSWLLPSLYVDLREFNPKHIEEYTNMVLHILNKKSEAPPVTISDALITGQLTSTPEATLTLDIFGQYRDSAGSDEIFFQQLGNRVVGIYNFGFPEKTGVLLGSVKGNYFDFMWKWFFLGYNGFGKMKISNHGKLLSGFFWYANKPRIKDHVGYVYETSDMPTWLSLTDFVPYSAFLNGQDA